MGENMILEILANYSVELDDAGSLARKGQVQIKYARAILNQIKNLGEVATATEPPKLCYTQFSGWTACADKLPEKRGYYLCYGYDRNHNRMYKVLFLISTKDGFGDDEYCTKATHWSPLPEPPNNFV